MSLIEKLTPEEEALIPVYREKWQKIALSTERIDREKAAKVVKAAYTAINKQDPEIIFCESPYAGLKIIYKKLPNLSFNNLEFLSLNDKVCGYITANLTNKHREFLYQINKQILGKLTIVEPSFTPQEYVL